MMMLPFAYTCKIRLFHYDTADSALFTYAANSTVSFLPSETDIGMERFQDADACLFRFVPTMPRRRQARLCWRYFSLLLPLMITKDADRNDARLLAAGHRHYHWLSLRHFSTRFRQQIAHS